ncbi:pectate lyase [Rubinisphaera sp. JC750]|uniref:pectate lyase n=1 Tax=Rubinisphaera sp. JC750 TaxID=2898658 RepID=UPI001F026AB2|nr:pectate lyase [Rubinisphaera sp. JC750]
MNTRAVVCLLLLPLFLLTPARAEVEFSKNLLKKNDAWFQSDEARKIADSVLQYQSPQGGWPKNTNLARTPKNPKDVPQPDDHLANSLDNEATTLPLQFLARMAHATGEAKYRDAFERGLDYLFAAQYPNGGWPQFWPLRKGYYSHITYNDEAMIRVMTLLRDVAEGKQPYEFVPAEHRQKAAAAVDRGIDCILKTQIRQNGQLTAWCAQHDVETYEPAWARSFEPPSLSGGESVGIVRFLMSIDDPSDEVVAAVEGAINWLREAQMHGWRIDEVKNSDGRVERKLVADPNAPPLWARFYELETNRPLYVDRDSVYRYDYNEISYERRCGYWYHGDWADSLLEHHYPAWKKRQSRK